MKTVLIFILTYLSLAGVGCSNDGLPEYNQLGGLRILSIAANTPEANPDDTVTLTPVVSDFPTSKEAGGRTLTYAVEACVDPGVALGANASCAQNPTRAVIAPSGTAVGALSPNSTSYTGTAPQVTIKIPKTILTARTPADQYNGVAYLVIYTLTATDTAGTAETLTSIKRIIASSPSKTLKNTNPVLTGALADSQGFQTYLNALTYGPSPAPVTLTPQFAQGSTETYSLLKNDGSYLSRAETLTTTWFYGDGTLKRFRTSAEDANTYTPPNEAPSGAHTELLFYVVTRDGRGGESVLRFNK